MTEKQMNRALRGFSTSYAFKALQQLVERKKVDIALELLALDLDSPEAKKLQGRPLGMIQLLAEIENIPDAASSDDDTV